MIKIEFKQILELLKDETDYEVQQDFIDMFYSQEFNSYVILDETVIEDVIITYIDAVYEDFANNEYYCEITIPFQAVKSFLIEKYINYYDLEDNELIIDENNDIYVLKDIYNIKMCSYFDYDNEYTELFYDSFIDMFDDEYIYYDFSSYLYKNSYEIEEEEPE